MGHRCRLRRISLQEKTMKRFCRWGVAIAVVCTFLLTMLAATPASAQTFRGSILGTVTDTSGAAVVGAAVTIHNVATGIDRVTPTNADGNQQGPVTPVC